MFRIWMVTGVLVVGIIVAVMILSQNDSSMVAVREAVTVSAKDKNIEGDVTSVIDNSLEETFPEVDSAGLPHNLVLFSPHFREHEKLPLAYTCYRNNYSPELQWDRPPKGTRSFAIFLTRDNGVGPFVSWIIFNIAADKAGLPGNIDKTAVLPDGSVQAITDHNNAGYSGPCEPQGRYEYTFRLFALDIMLDLEGGADKDDVLRAMLGHVLDADELVVEHYSRF